MLNESMCLWHTVYENMVLADDIFKNNVFKEYSLIVTQLRYKSIPKIAIYKTLALV